MALEESTRSSVTTRPILIAGVTGDTRSATAEAKLAASLGYDAVLVAPQRGLDEAGLIERSARVGAVLPTIGFYLQQSVGGRVLSRDYWRAIASLESTIAIKVAPFNRYHTIDVLNGVAESGRADQVALYTGNDDSIVTDLLLAHHSTESRPERVVRFVGGLLGQWSLWTSVAVTHLELVHAAHQGDTTAYDRLQKIGTQLTDANAAVFDAANGFRGCIPGIHEVLRRHGLLQGVWCLDRRETLSPGQLAEIDRVWRLYPELRDDEFISAHIDEWLS